MTEEQIKYQKKRNTLIYIMMFLLVVFVALTSTELGSSCSLPATKSTSNLFSVFVFF